MPWQSWLQRVRSSGWDELSFAGARTARLVPPSVARGVRFAVDLAQRPRAEISRVIGDRVTMRYVGNDAHFRHALGERLGASEVVHEGWSSRLGVAARAKTDDVDVLAVEIDRSQAARFAAEGFLVMPRWVSFSIDLRRDEHALWGGKKREVVHRIERAGLTFEIAEDDDARREFYHAMYAPTARARHGELAFVRGPRFVARAANHGRILFVREGSTRVAGMLLVDRAGRGGGAGRAGDQRAIDALLMGVRDGDYARVGPLCREATYLFSVRWARDVAGATTLGLTAAYPFLDDGLFRFKKRWGGVASLNAVDGRAVAMRWCRAHASLVERLSKVPFVHLDLIGGDARLTATTIAHRRARAWHGKTSGIYDPVTLVGEGESLVERVAARARACRAST